MTPCRFSLSAARTTAGTPTECATATTGCVAPPGEFRHAVAPGFDFGIVPVFLDHAAGGSEISFPAALPVVGA